jgi:hypothetical protein
MVGANLDGASGKLVEAARPAARSLMARHTHLLPFIIPVLDNLLFLELA